MKVEIKKVENSKVIYKITMSRKLQRYFLSNKLWIKYNFDVRDIPEAILAVPAVGYILPLAFATGEKIFVKVLDKNFYTSITSLLRSTIKQMYPKLPVEKMDVLAELIEDNIPQARAVG